MHARLVTFVGSLTLLLAMATPAAAQGSGEITGTITDASGGVIPGATVVLTNTETGAVRHGVSNDAGVYSMPALPPGNYTIAVELQGFQGQTRENLVLQVQ